MSLIIINFDMNLFVETILDSRRDAQACRRLHVQRSESVAAGIEVPLSGCTWP